MTDLSQFRLSTVDKIVEDERKRVEDFNEGAWRAELHRLAMAASAALDRVVETCDELEGLDG